MISQPVNHNIASKAVDKFLLIFTHRSRAANRAKAGRWWRGRLVFLPSLETPINNSLHITRRNSSGIMDKKTAAKALHGRGRKRKDWVNMLHQSMLNEFVRLRNRGIKFNGSILQEMALKVLQNPDFPEQQMGEFIDTVISKNWIQNFKNRFNIVSRVRTSNTCLRDAKVQYYKKCMSHMLGNIKSDYDNGMKERDVENLDETHMVFDMDNKRVLDFQGKKRITYSEISSAGQGFTLVVRISGTGGGQIEVPMVIFQNNLRSYPIATCPDDLDGVCFRS